MSAGERTLDTTASARPSAATRKTGEAPPLEPRHGLPPVQPPGGKPADIHTLPPGAEHEQLAVIPTTDEEHGAVGQNGDAVRVPQVRPPSDRGDRKSVDAIDGV